MSREDPFEALFREFYDRLLRLCEPIIAREVGRIRVRLPETREDLRQVARQAVLEALPGYDRSRPFAPFIRRCIRHALYREVRRDAPPQYWEHRRLIATFDHELRQKLRRAPTIEETAAAAGLTGLQVDQVKRWTVMIEADEPESGIEVPDASEPIEVADANEPPATRVAILRAAIARLDPKERQVFEQVELDEKSIKEVAGELKHTPDYVKQILHRASTKVWAAVLSGRNHEFLEPGNLEVLLEWYSAGRFREPMNGIPAPVATSMQRWPERVLRDFCDGQGHCDGDLIRRRYEGQAEWLAGVDDPDRSFAAEFGWMKPLMVAETCTGERDRKMELREVFTADQLAALQRVYREDAEDRPSGAAGLLSALRTLAHLLKHPNYQNFGGKSPVTSVKPLLVRHYLENTALTPDEIAKERTAMRAILEHWSAAAPSTAQSRHGGGK